MTHQLTIANFSEVKVFQLKENKPAVMKALCHIAEQVARVSGKEIPAGDIAYIINDLAEVHSHESIGTHLEAFKRLARSKVYGKITLGALMEIHEEIINEKADQRIAEHYARKGFGESEVR